MANLCIMIGPAGCGKSTVAKEVAKDASFCTIVSSDEIRKELYKDETVQKDHAKVFKLAHERVIENLKAGKDVIFDATNLLRVHRKELIECVAPFANRVVGVVYDGDLETCLKRNASRDRHVPEDVISRMYSTLHGKHNKPIVEEGFDILYSMKAFREDWNKYL